jgi:hypothetical protein
MVLLIAISGCSDIPDTEVILGEWYLNKLEVNNEAVEQDQIMPCLLLKFNDNNTFASIQHTSYLNGGWSIKNETLETFQYHDGEKFAYDYSIHTLSENQLILRRDSSIYYFMRYCEAAQRSPRERRLYIESIKNEQKKNDSIDDDSIDDDYIDNCCDSIQTL